MQISRRALLQTGLTAGFAAAFLDSGAASAKAKGAVGAFGQPVSTALTGHGPVGVRWLEGGVPAQMPGGTTWGVPWPKGAVGPDQQFQLTGVGGEPLPLQSWTTGWWPDGSVKWTAHAVSSDAPKAASYSLQFGAPSAPAVAIQVDDNPGRVRVDTGAVVVEFPKNGENLISSIRRGETVIAEAGRLVAARQGVPDTDGDDSVEREWFHSRVTGVKVEQRGPVRAVIRVQGTHKKGKREWLPFDVRFYLYAGTDGVRVVHSFVFDGDGDKDFISGLGFRFTVPLSAQPHDRHIRFAGDGEGVLGEAVRGITGLRRDPGAAARTAQVAGQWTPDPSTWDQRVTARLNWIPTWGDYSLTQLNANGFEIRKRTARGHSWIRVDSGRRARGLAYVGTPAGGLAFGMRNFWQLHPTELEISGAATDTATATAWMWSPKAQAMDLRFYHDGMGQDTYPEQLDALEITYEDYEPGFGSPYGVARTTEFSFWALGGTPSAQDFSALADANATPPLLISSPEHNHSAGVFGSWAPVDRSNMGRIAIEDKLAFMHQYYVNQVDQRSWYGFWDYGDVMHEFDGDRHVWRYDIGGYAWDNSELSTDMWLWYHYLRTGDAAAFRFAEAMTRHTGEVDVYHLGTYADLGTRHGIMHWGDSAKQQRISNAGYRRFYYFLTADERVGDLMHDLVDADKTFLVLDPGRKIREEAYDPQPNALGVSTTTDWGALGLAWLAEWERNGDEIARTKLINGAKTIAALPNGWAQGGEVRYDMADGRFTGPDTQSVEVGSLDSVFGLFELMTELIDLIDEDQVRDQWVTYCRLYNGTSDEQIAATGVRWGSQNLRQAYSRATAYAASQLGDAALGKRAWKEFRTGHAGYPEALAFASTRIEGPAVLNPIDEAPFSTNASAQFGLAAIQCLALVGDQI